MRIFSAKHHGINLNEIAAYIDAFKYGCPPHAGGNYSAQKLIINFMIRWYRYGACYNVVPWPS